MDRNYIPPKDAIVVCDGKIFLNGKELPPLPRNQKIKGYPYAVNGIPHINGYELVNNKWKKTLKALMYLCF